MPDQLDAGRAAVTGGSVLRRSAASITRHSLFRFAASGGISVGVDVALLYLLHGVAGMWLPLATFLAVALSFGVNFGLNRVWSFGSRQAAHAQLARYLVLAAGNWLFTVAAVANLAALHVHYLIAKVITVAVAAVLNYLGYRYWVFR